MGCKCGQARGRTVAGRWEVVDQAGTVVSEHQSSVQARVAAAKITGARARPKQAP